MRWFLIFIILIGVCEVVHSVDQCEVTEPAGRGFGRVGKFFRTVFRGARKYAKKIKRFAKTTKKVIKQAAKWGKKGEEVLDKVKDVVELVQDTVNVIQEFSDMISIISLPECQNCKLARKPGQYMIQTKLMRGTGCRCDSEKQHRTECICCFKVGNLDFKMCLAAALTSDEKELYVLINAENVVIYDTKIKLNTWMPSMINLMDDCIEIGPPIIFTNACIQLTFEKPSRATDQHWILCIELHTGMIGVKALSTIPPCLKIKSGQDNHQMLLEGQDHPNDDVRDLLDSDVIDDNYDPMVCLTNAGKKGKARHSYNIFNKRRNRLTSKLGWNPSRVGATPFLAILHESVFPKPLRKLREHLDKYPIIRNGLDQADEWIERTHQHTMERSCGGALLSPNKVLTVCGCMRSFYFMNVFKKPLPPRRRAGSHDFDIRAADIYLEFSGITYSGGESYKLERNDEDFLDFLSKSKCANVLTKKKRSGRRGDISEVLTVMKFGPEIKRSDPNQFVQWPPLIVKHPKGKVHMVGFGLEPLNETWTFEGEPGKDIDLRESSVDFHLKPCGEMKRSKKKLLKGATPFCPETKNFQLCGGKIGHPLVLGSNSSQLIGLSVSAPDCDSVGTTMALLFTEETIREIHDMKQEGQTLTAQLVTCSLPWIHAWWTVRQ